MFSMRIVTTEWGMRDPVAVLDNTYSDFRDHVVYKVPVINIFGSTPEGGRLIIIPWKTII